MTTMMMQIFALETEGNFDSTTGLWKFKSETTHKPMEQFDVNLIKHMAEKYRIM